MKNYLAVCNSFFGFLCFVILGTQQVITQECLSRDFGNGGTVCVCTEHHCDIAPPLGKIPSNSYITYTSNKAGLRFKKSVQKLKIARRVPKEHFQDGCIQDVHVEYEICSVYNTTDKYRDIYQEINKEWHSSQPRLVIIDRSITYQKIIGFGGAFSDSTAINIKLMSDNLQNYLMRSYFSEEGLEFNLCRVPMGGTDFSTHAYSYIDSNEDEVNCVDPTLSNFKLKEEDYFYKIPVIHEAIRLTKKTLQLFTSTWVAPKAFKENNNYRGTMGFIKKSLYQLWADYFVKFLNLYKEAGISFWGITTGNEPFVAMMQWEGIPGVLWFPDDQSRWIRQNLVPTLRNSIHRNIKVIALDDQRPLLLTALPKVFANRTNECVQGVGLHWYMDYDNNTYMLDEFHELYPNLFLLATEACAGDFVNNVRLGAWDRGERYAWDIAQDLNHWVAGWVDWNMVLNTDGGPKIAGPVDSPIIFNETCNEFYKQPTYYAMGHFSKFITRGSVRIYSSQCDNDKLTAVTAFRRPDGNIVIVLINRYGVRDLVVKKDSVLLCLSYTPKDTTLKRKFGNLPIKYLRTNLENDEQLKLFELAVKRYSFGLGEDQEIPSPQVELPPTPIIKNRKIIRKQTPSTSKQAEEENAQVWTFDDDDNDEGGENLTSSSSSRQQTGQGDKRRRVETPSAENETQIWDLDDEKLVTYITGLK